jgi:UDP:flavonoid glycosyltransferase YjiC (YdhE family)
MRILFTSTRGAGHFIPLVPLLDACVRIGHEALVAGPSALSPAVDASGYRFWECADAAEADIWPVWARVAQVSPEEANELVVRELFAGFEARAILPRVREAFEVWEPDLVLRDPNEYGSVVAAELHGVRHGRVGISLGAVEEVAVAVAAGRIDELRSEVGLPPDPAGERIRQSPYLTSFPHSLEHPTEPAPPDVVRFHAAVARAARPLPDWWSGRGGPLVYVTFGTVAAGLPSAAAVFPMALEALADVPVRVLLTVGRDGDSATLGSVPPNVHVEQWVSHADVVAVADIVVCHGGSGTVLGTLAAGLPQVVVPLFADQPYNAQRVEAVGAGLVVEPRAEAIRAAVLRILEDNSFRLSARLMAAEIRLLPSADRVLAGLLASLTQADAA